MKRCLDYLNNPNPDDPNHSQGIEGALRGLNDWFAQAVFEEFEREIKMTDRQRIEPSKEAIEAVAKLLYGKCFIPVPSDTYDLRVSLEAAYAIDFAECQQLRLALQEAEAKYKPDALWAPFGRSRIVELESALQESQQKYERELQVVLEYQTRELNLLSDLRESQQRVRELEGWDESRTSIMDSQRQTIMQQQTVIQELADALRKAQEDVCNLGCSRLPAYDHNDLCKSITAALASASPWLRKEGEK